MNRLTIITAVLMMSVIAGCNSDVVTTERLRTIEYKCVYVAPIQSEDPYIGKVISDVMEKEFVRRNIAICGPENATVIITGCTFMTVRAAANASELSSNRSAAANQAIDSISAKVKDRQGNLLATASYNNKDQYTVSKLAAEFGAALARKIK
ncbi:MAG: hypothetical protein FVQ80_10910 [Planctomycetes bacterium]|nr:hypothetical protein [Planctomycetota bacterium]